MLIWKFVEYHMSTKHLQTDHKTHGWARAPWVTWLGKASRSEMTGQVFQECHAWAIALRRWNLEFRRELLLEWNDRASAQEVTELEKCSRSDMTGQELKKCHDWARAPGVSWLGTSSRSDMTGHDLQVWHDWAWAPGVTWLGKISWSGMTGHFFHIFPIFGFGTSFFLSFS